MSRGQTLLGRPLAVLSLALVCARGDENHLRGRHFSVAGAVAAVCGGGHPQRSLGQRGVRGEVGGGGWGSRWTSQVTGGGLVFDSAGAWVVKEKPPPIHAGPPGGFGAGGGDMLGSTSVGAS